MLTIKEVIKVFYNALMQKLKSHRGNWDQNDPNADDYIKNKPFYTDESNKETVVKFIKFTADESGWWGSPFRFIPVVGEIYKVEFDDITYYCQAYFDNYSNRCIGNNVVNGAINNGAINNGEPFYYYYNNNYDYGICVFISGKHTIKIEKIKVEKLDKRYIPDLGLANVAYSGNYYDLNNTPSIYTDVVRYSATQSLSTSQKTRARSNIDAAVSSHTHNASTITAGTFAGQVVANASAQSPNTSLLRNSRLVNTEATPSNNGEIYWMYE